MEKTKLWDREKSWEEAESLWDETAVVAKEETPVRSLRMLPQMPGISAETKPGLKWKSLKYMLKEDSSGMIFRNILKHPLRYTLRFLRSVFRKKSYKRDGDFFYYNVESEKAFQRLLVDDDALLVVGFSYCHKPFECPSGRFTDACMADIKNPVCQQCFIGKCVHALPKERVIPLFIPTIHYIGEKIFEIVHQNPKRRVLFIITACEMTLEMFGDWGNMVGIEGIGVRLDGRICNTMKAFELSERGIKPGLTVVLDDTQKRILRLIRIRREKTATTAD